MGTTSALRHGTGSGPGEDRDRGEGRFGRIARSPLGWMTVGVVGVGLVSVLTATGPGPVPVLGAVAAVAVYCLVMRRVARRPTPEIARSGAGREALPGGGIGPGFILVSALLITAFGGYSFSRAGDGLMSVLRTAIAVQIGAAVTEELLFRGLALQALEQLRGSRAAIVITSLFFGVAHLGTPGANAWSGLAIALEAGLLLGAVFLWRRSTWFVVGLHFAWNTTQQLLGIPVSGHLVEGLFTVDVHGPALLTGGGFGLEASIVPILIGMALAVSMLVLAHRNGGIKSRRRAGR
ncbi:CPBP family intramembrane metalloprotease [Streptomyces sp. IF17]|nr:CPBP family intramembrane glutamic endopeptidase [Streptomyces alkaliphilus]MQS05948.1 CPBP family intramembrane metalloprotease [Streptomyces alkaliphilus]